MTDTIAATLRQKLTPLLADLHFAGTMQRVHQVIRRLFREALEITVPEYAPDGAALEDYREGLRAAGVAAAFAVELAMAGSDAPQALRQYVAAVMEAFVAHHLDPTLSAVVNGDEFFERIVIEIYEDFSRARYGRLAQWTGPAKKPTKKSLHLARMARVARFLKDNPGAIEASIYGATEVPSASYYRWLRGERSDTADVSIRIDAVLAGRTPLCPNEAKK